MLQLEKECECFDKLKTAEGRGAYLDTLKEQTEPRCCPVCKKPIKLGEVTDPALLAKAPKVGKSNLPAAFDNVDLPTEGPIP